MATDEKTPPRGKTRTGLNTDTYLHNTPASGGNQQRQAKDADPSVITRELISATAIDGSPRWKFWSGDWLEWRDGRYIPIPEVELRASVCRFLDQHWSHVKTGHVINILEHLRASLIVKSVVAIPAWLCEPPHGFATNECVATPNTVIHLPSWAAGVEPFSVPASPNYFTLNALAFDADLNARPPSRWLKFLADILPDDQASIDTLQEMFGYLLTPDTRQHKVFALIGPKRSGKGTIAHILSELLGYGNVVAPILSSLSSRFGLAPLIGKSLAVVGDARLSPRVDSSELVTRILTVSGGDKVSVERKGLPNLECELPTRFLLLSNEVPKLLDDSAAIVSRFVLLRMTTSFEGREDTELLAKLKTELPGILFWAMQGWRRLHARGCFVQPESGKALLGMMSNLASPVSAFVKDHCNVASGATCTCREFYVAFTTWCDYAGISHVPTEEQVGKALNAALPQVTKTRPRSGGKRLYCYSGIELTESDDNQTTNA